MPGLVVLCPSLRSHLPARPQYVAIEELRIRKRRRHRLGTTSTARSTLKQAINRGEWKMIYNTICQNDDDQFYTAVCAYVRGEPNGIEPGTAGEEQAEI